MTSAADWARLQRLAAALSPIDATWLLTTYGPRCHRIKMRDELICDTVARFYPGLPTVSAKKLARALSGHHGSNWQWEQESGLPQTADERHTALHNILRLNAGKPLCWRQIVDLL